MGRQTEARRPDRRLFAKIQVRDDSGSDWGSQGPGIFLT